MRFICIYVQIALEHQDAICSAQLAVQPQFQPLRMLWEGHGILLSYLHKFSIRKSHASLLWMRPWVFCSVEYQPPALNKDGDSTGGADVIFQSTTGIQFPVALSVFVGGMPVRVAVSVAALATICRWHMTVYTIVQLEWQEPKCWWGHRAPERKGSIANTG